MLPVLPCVKFLKDHTLLFGQPRFCLFLFFFLVLFSKVIVFDQDIVDLKYYTFHVYNVMIHSF